MYHNISGSLETFKAMTLPKKVKNLQTVQPRRRSSISPSLSLQNIPSSIRHFSKSHRHSNILIWKTNVPGQSLTRPVDAPCWNALLKAVDLANFSDSGIVVEKRFSVNPEAQDVFQ